MEEQNELNIHIFAEGNLRAWDVDNLSALPKELWITYADEIRAAI